MPLRNPITEPQIPQPIARDSEVTAAVAAHVAAADPHTQYLLQSEGDARYRPFSVPLTNADIPTGIARDIETLSVAPRTGGNAGITIDANTTIPQGTPATIKWIDGNNTYANFPFSTVSGTLVQVDALYDTILVGKYMFQIFALPDQAKIYYRAKSNGTWGSWAALA